MALPLNPTLDQLFNYLKVERGLAPNTLESYGRDLRRFSAYLEEEKVEDFADVQASHILSYMIRLHEEGLSTRTVARNLVSLRVLFKFLVRNRGLVADPTVHVDSPKLWRKLPEILTQEEVERLLAQPGLDDQWGIRDTAMLELMYATGLRITELVTLQLSQLNLDHGFLIAYGKGRKERLVPMGSKAQTQLVQYLQNARPILEKGYDDAPVFLSRNGKGMSRQAFWKIIKKKSEVKLKRRAT